MWSRHCARCFSYMPLDLQKPLHLRPPEFGDGPKSTQLIWDTAWTRTLVWTCPEYIPFHLSWPEVLMRQLIHCLLALQNVSWVIERRTLWSKHWVGIHSQGNANTNIIKRYESKGEKEIMLSNHMIICTCKFRHPQMIEGLQDYLALSFYVESKHFSF